MPVTGNHIREMLTSHMVTGYQVPNLSLIDIRLFVCLDKYMEGLVILQSNVDLSCEMNHDHWLSGDGWRN